MLSIIALEDGVDSSLVTTVNDTLTENNRNLQGASQQTANGLYRSAELIYLISLHSYPEKVSDLVYQLLEAMYEDNENCTGAPQQTANGMATIYYMLMCLAYAES